MAQHFHQHSLFLLPLSKRHLGALITCVGQSACPTHLVRSITEMSGVAAFQRNTQGHEGEHSRGDLMTLLMQSRRCGKVTLRIRICPPKKVWTTALCRLQKGPSESFKPRLFSTTVTLEAKSASSNPLGKQQSYRVPQMASLAAVVAVPFECYEISVE